jgi:hypothetical protein
MAKVSTWKKDGHKTDRLLSFRAKSRNFSPCMYVRSINSFCCTGRQNANFCYFVHIAVVIHQKGWAPAKVASQLCTHCFTSHAQHICIGNIETNVHFDTFFAAAMEEFVFFQNIVAWFIALSVTSITISNSGWTQIFHHHQCSDQKSKQQLTQKTLLGHTQKLIGGPEWHYYYSKVQRFRACQILSLCQCWKRAANLWPGPAQEDFKTWC